MTVALYSARGGRSLGWGLGWVRLGLRVLEAMGLVREGVDGVNGVVLGGGAGVVSR